MAIITIVAVISSCINEYLYIKTKVHNQYLTKELIEQSDRHIEVLKYCLQFIIVQSAEKEDYETAQKCKEMLDTLK